MKNKLNLFKGRIGVCNFWLGILLTFPICIPIGFLPDRIKEYQSVIFNIPLILLEIIIFIYFLSLIIRRLHDHNKSGWFGLATYIPIYGLYVLILMFYIPGDKETNKYGLPKNKINIKNILGIAEE